MTELGAHGDSMRNRLKQQADLFYGGHGPSQALKEEVEAEYAESKARKPNEEAENARMVGKGQTSYLAHKHSNLEPKRLVKKTKEDLTEKFVSDFSKLTGDELDKGVMNMLIRGLIPPDVDLGKAFDSDFFTTTGITPAKPRELKSARQLLQDYVDSMVMEDRAFGQRLTDVTAGVLKKGLLEKERLLVEMRTMAARLQAETASSPNSTTSSAHSSPARPEKPKRSRGSQRGGSSGSLRISTSADETIRQLNHKIFRLEEELAEHQRQGSRLKRKETFRLREAERLKSEVMWSACVPYIGARVCVVCCVG